MSCPLPVTTENPHWEDSHLSSMNNDAATQQRGHGAAWPTKAAWSAAIEGGTIASSQCFQTLSLARECFAQMKLGQMRWRGDYDFDSACHKIPQINQTKPNKKLDGKVWQQRELTRIQMAEKAISGYWSAQHLCHPFKGGNPFLNSGSGMPWSAGSEKQQSSSWQLPGCIPPSQRSGLSSPASSHLSFFSHLHLPASWQPPAQRKKNKQKCLLIKDH